MAARNTALWLPKIGDKFVLNENQIPEPGPGEILVKIEATALNPIDCTIQKEGFSILVPEYPAVIGENGSGIVEQVGSGVTNLAKGDRVAFQSAYSGTKYGTFQQYCLAVAELASKVPDNVSLDEAAPVTVCFNPFAVATYAQQPYGIALTPPFESEGLGKYANQPIVILGGASSLGQFGIQLARLSGFNPIITTASLRNKDLLSSLGATHVLDRTLPVGPMKERITDIARAPVTYIFDAVSVAETQQMAYDLLAPCGTVAVVTEVLVKEDKASDKKVLMVYGTFHIPGNRELGAKFATALTIWLAGGKIKPNPVEVLPGGLNGISAGLETLGTGGVSAKKLVVRPHETTVGA